MADQPDPAPEVPAPSAPAAEVPAAGVSAAQAPAPLKVSGGLTLLAGLATLATAGWLAFDTVREPPIDPTAGWAAVALLAVFGVAVLAVGRGVLRAAGWSRGPAVVTQLLLLALGSQLANPVVVAVVVAGAVVALALLFLPPSTAAFLESKRRRQAERGGGTA